MRLDGQPGRYISVMPSQRIDQAVRKDGDPRKLGEILAQHIEDEIISRGWPVGTVLGSEADLIEQYGVSRAVFREAMRIVDHHGVAEMRRGPGGGLVITEPDLGAVVRAVSLQLRFEHIQTDQVTEARNALEISCVRLAAQRITPAGEVRIRETLDHEIERIKQTRHSRRVKGDLPSHDFHVLIAELSGNPAMSLFAQMINRVLGEQAPRQRSLEQVAHDVHQVHTRIAEAVIAGDADAAERRMARHLRSVNEYLTPQARKPRKTAAPATKRAAT
jgi:DNA-binding FadR family transcriptional regulator